MNFYMLVTTIIAAFLCGIIVVGSFSLCSRLMNGSKISDLGSTLLLFAISLGSVLLEPEMLIDFIIKMCYSKLRLMILLNSPSHDVSKAGAKIHLIC